MDDNRKYFILNIVISACIGIIVGIVEVMLPHVTAESFVIIGVDAFIGIVIGLSIRQASIFVCESQDFKKFFVIAFFLLAAIMVFFRGLRAIATGEPIFDASLLVGLIIAEFFGMSWTYFSYRYYENMNDLLALKQQEFLKSKSGGVIKLDK